jgi:hypothetical protein
MWGKFQQEEKGLSKDYWQIAYDEKFLNANGTEVIDEPSIGESVRFAFYLHFVKLDQPLLIPYGKITLLKPTAMPNRLKNLFKYVPVD